MAGAPFSLKCQARGYPDPQISWTLNEEPLENGFRGHIIDTDGTMSVEAATDRTALYRCIAANNAGKDDIEYTVHAVSAPVVSQEGDVILNATEGDPADLICKIEGEDSKIGWQKVRYLGISSFYNFTIFYCTTLQRTIYNFLQKPSNYYSP